MMIRKLVYSAALLVLPFVLMGGSCSTDPNYSGNYASTLNVTGNYNVITTPNPQITNITLTQTGNLIQAVDNLGTVYSGSVTEDITSVSVNQGTTFVTVSATMQGTDRNGKVITITFTHVNAVGFIFPAVALDASSTATVTTDVVTVGAIGTQQTNIVSSEIAISSMFGTYMDSTNVSGSFEMISNAVEPFVVLL